MALSIQGSFPDEKNRRRLDIAETALLRMKDLVEKLLTLARGDAEEGEADAASFVPVDLTYLLSCSTASFEPVFFDAGRCLRVEIAPGCQMMGSAGKLLELFGILLDNACKYSAPGSTVTVRLEREGGRICRTYAISVTATNTLEISYHPAKSTLPVWGRWKIF